MSESLSKAQVEALTALKQKRAEEQQHLLEDVKDRVARSTFNEYSITPDDDSWTVPSDSEHRKIISDQIARSSYKMLGALQQRLLRMLVPGQPTSYNNQKGPHGWESIQYLRQFPNSTNIIIEDLRDQYRLRITDGNASLTVQGAVMATIGPLTRDLPEEVITILTIMYFGADNLREQL